MTPEHNLNGTKSTGLLAVAEAHSLACWAELERHVTQGKTALYRPQQRCGCYKHEQAGHIVILKSCVVGETLHEEYEIASRRVREIQTYTSPLGGVVQTIEIPVDVGCRAVKAVLK